MIFFMQEYAELLQQDIQRRLQDDSGHDKS